MKTRPRTTTRTAKRSSSRAPVKSAETLTLRELRDGLGMTRAELARLLGATERSIASWENGREPGDAHGRAIKQLRRLWSTASNVMKPAHIGEWLRSPLDALDGLKPMEAIERGEHDRVWQVLFAVESGGFR